MPRKRDLYKASAADGVVPVAGPAKDDAFSKSNSVGRRESVAQIREQLHRLESEIAGIESFEQDPNSLNVNLRGHCAERRRDLEQKVLGLKLDLALLLGSSTTLRSQAVTSDQGAWSQPKPIGRPPSEYVARRREVIRHIAATGATGERYCTALDAAKLPTPIEWQKREGCPKTYSQAWNHLAESKRRKWRQRIADEKSKATRNSNHSPKVTA